MRLHVGRRQGEWQAGDGSSCGRSLYHWTFPKTIGKMWIQWDSDCMLSFQPSIARSINDLLIEVDNAYCL